VIVGDAKSRTLIPSLALVAVLAAVGAFVPLDSSLRFALIAAMGWAVAAIGLDLLVGYTGQVSFGQAAFAGVGAYLSAGFRVHLHLQWLPAALLALVATAVLAALLGSVMVRLPAFGFAIVSLFSGYVVITVLNGNTLAGWTGGAAGLAVPPYPLTAPGQEIGFFLAVAGILAVAVLLTCQLADSQTGRALRMIKSNEVVAAANGVRVRTLKVFAFAYCCALAAVGGIIYSAVVGFLGPDNFNVNQSVLLFAMLVVGGAGTVGGPILGALLITVLPTYYLRSGAQSAIAFAAILLVFLILLPDGISGLAIDGWRFVRRRIRRRGRTVADVVGPVERPVVEETPGTGEVALEVEDLVVRFGDFTALDGVDVTVRRGSVHAIVGPNGAGKTTLLNTISGVYTPASGDIRLDGRSTLGLRPYDIRNRGVMRTFQNPTVVPDLSVLDNVKLGLDTDRRHSVLLDIAGRLATGKSENALAAAARWALRAVGVAPDADGRYVKGLDLSGQKRVELARGLVGQGRILLLDEPTAGLSVGEMDSLAETLRQVHHDYRLTIVVISHHIGFVLAIADELTVLDYGKVLAHGEPAEVLARPDVARTFTGIEAEEKAVEAVEAAERAAEPADRVADPSVSESRA
jgi:branched-chain amino acid transport system permease protein